MTSVSGSVVLDLLQDRQAVGVGQREVEQDQVYAVAMLGDGVAGRAGLDGPVALFFQPVDERPANEGLIVNDQDGGVRHQWRPDCRRSTRRFKSSSSNGLSSTVAPSDARLEHDFRRAERRHQNQGRHRHQLPQRGQ